jgi:hypothetical protein
VGLCLSGFKSRLRHHFFARVNFPSSQSSIPVLPELYHELIMTGIRRSSLALRILLDARHHIALLRKHD